ncbi:glycosyltransferase, partial [Candidatus Falkowbacteria bacterium]|nr:glycosyltransferase [Candidatus Falkowbacteria bacterium]
SGQAGSGRCGFLVKPKDVGGLALKIEWILSHSEEAGEMGRAGQEKVREKYDWIKIGEKLNRILKDDK